jgi:uncharacterized membrane protein
MNDRGRKTSGSDRIWLALIFLFVLALGGLIVFTSMKRKDEVYRNSNYYAEINNLMFEVQEETLQEVGM